VVDSRSKIQSVQNSNKEEIKETSGDHFKDLSKTSSKNFYPEVVTEHSREVVQKDLGSNRDSTLEPGEGLFA